MIYVSHPYEGETKELLSEREVFGKFITAHIINFFPEEVVMNFPLNYILIRQELGMRSTDEETLKTSLEWLGRADAAIFLDFPGRELCRRSMAEMKAAKRLDIPMAIFPFYRHRFDQQMKQNALLSEQKRVLNLIRANLQDS